MCTVMLRFDPGAAWPILLAAVRDEFMQRAWDPPAVRWPDLPNVIGGRDRVAGGTWMAVRQAIRGADNETRPAVAALLNGVRRGDPVDGSTRPTRGRLVLAALSAVDIEPTRVPGIADDTDLAQYDGFHLVLADISTVHVWSWDGDRLGYQSLAPGDHIIVNLGADRDDDPLVPHFRPLLERTANPPLSADADTGAAWAGWVDLLRGDNLALDDPRGLIIEQEVSGTFYGSTSESLVGLAASGAIRYDFATTPQAPKWVWIIR
jgi:uncharacterized protein with NRDE domain